MTNKGKKYNSVFPYRSNHWRKANKDRKYNNDRSIGSLVIEIEVNAYLRKRMRVRAAQREVKLIHRDLKNIAKVLLPKNTVVNSCKFISFDKEET